MTRNLLASIALLLTLVVAAPGAEGRKIAYALDTGLFAAQLDGSGAKKLVAGADPDISPDGTRVAYTHSDAKGDRFIAIFDLATAKRTILSQIPGKNSYGPIWTPDGAALSFNIFVGDTWHIGFVQADGSGYRYLKKAASSERSVYAITWQADGQAFYCHDLEAIYRCDLQGNEKQKWLLSSVVPKGSFSSSSSMSISRDGRTLLVEMDMDEPFAKPLSPGPPSAIWAIDVASGKATRLTDKSIFQNGEPRWISENEYLLTSYGGSDKKSGVLRATVGSPGRTLVVKDGRNASVSSGSDAPAASAPAKAPAAAAAPAEAASAGAIKSAPSKQAEFTALRAEWNRISDGKDWKEVRHEMKKEKKGQRHYALGWFEGTELKMIMHVNADSETDSTICFYYYFEGALTSVFERRKGAHTEMSEIANATETYNFVREKMVGWKRTDDSKPDGTWVDPKDEGFADTGKEIFQRSLKVSGPLFKAVKAD